LTNSILNPTPKTSFSHRKVHIILEGLNISFLKDPHLSKIFLLQSESKKERLRKGDPNLGKIPKNFIREISGIQSPRKAISRRKFLDLYFSSAHFHDQGQN